MPVGQSTPLSSKSNIDMDVSKSPSTEADTGAMDASTSTLKLEDSPTFTLYCDSELAFAASRESMSKELVNRLVRYTISNMRTACHNLKRPREPTMAEKEEMAKALCRKYPCLKMNEGNEQSQTPGKENEKLHVSYNMT